MTYIYQKFEYKVIKTYSLEERLNSFIKDGWEYVATLDDGKKLLLRRYLGFSSL